MMAQTEMSQSDTNTGFKERGGTVSGLLLNNTEYNETVSNKTQSTHQTSLQSIFTLKFNVSLKQIKLNHSFLQLSQLIYDKAFFNEWLSQSN